MIDKHRVTKAPANSGSLFYNEGNILIGGTGSCTTCKLGLLLSLQIRVIQDHSTDQIRLPIRLPQQI